MALPGQAPSLTLAALVAATMLALALLSQAAGAAPLVGKDGRIHACYKAKGKAKGTLRVVRSAKVRCPRGWKKTAWSAAGAPAAAGEQGSSGERGSSGDAGGTGAKGETGAQATDARVSSLESQVTELVAKLKSLEGVLAGITNTQLKEAIGSVPVVASLCTEAEKLNVQSNGLGTALSAFGALLGPLTGGALPAIPAALPPFSCPAP
jgi:hypothetical protein